MSTLQRPLRPQPTPNSPHSSLSHAPESHGRASDGLPSLSPSSFFPSNIESTSAMAVRLLLNLRSGIRRTRFNSPVPGNHYSPRNYSTSQPSSRHAAFYSETIPAMIPVFLLGSAIYLGLRLTQLNLSHERYMEEAEARIKKLEDDITTLEAARRK